MALATILRNAARPLVANSFKFSPVIRNAPFIRHSANVSMFQNQGTYLGLTGLNQIQPKIQQNQVRQAHMDHGLLWTVERAWAVGLLVIVPLTIITQSTIMDDIFAITTIIHNHWGLEAIVIDYVRPVIFGETIPKIALMICYAFSAIILGGLLYFNHNDIGIGKAIANFWNIRSLPPSSGGAQEKRSDSTESNEC
ncbi:succinate dehydrogenase [ubiquinone] cytochrome b small subunit, mitochondrial isoform X1 [Onthophagus taurus]|uniref:succinate dehydrogenase [ubiquinone] cytochrome b small subunit, mitochondrial isoform X1 n=2 Tax=Onthophagus taurus TaxID=166361 RepID=UPI0039BDBF8D